jgi:integrase/recombinase XerD
MLSTFFPQDSRRYQSLPILGPIMERYASWLNEQQYTWRSARYELRMAARVARYFNRRGLERIEDLDAQHLDACQRWFQRKYRSELGGFRLLICFLREEGLIETPLVSAPANQADAYVRAFMAHLGEVRGYARSTIRRQGQIAAEFLGWLHVVERPERLSGLRAEDLEGFTGRLSKRMGRVGLQKPIAILRNFLRFLAADGIVAPGLGELIERPRVYRQEQLPRSMPWSTVEALLASIDRTSPIGKRDFAMFSLMTTYGLRACDVVALSLDDIHWRGGCIRVRQSKTGKPVDLPLTDQVSVAIQDYLKHARRQGPHRQVFLRMRAPQGTLKSTAVIEAFQAWSRRSRLEIPYKGVHCIRHSYAVHLLRRGVPLKTIGDLLGHRSPESTAAYLRLATEDLRTVALPLPAGTPVEKEQSR